MRQSDTESETHEELMKKLAPILSAFLDHIKPTRALQRGGGCKIFGVAMPTKYSENVGTRDATPRVLQVLCRSLAVVKPPKRSWTSRGIAKN